MSNDDDNQRASCTLCCTSACYFGWMFKVNGGEYIYMRLNSQSKPAHSRNITNTTNIHLWPDIKYITIF